MSRMRDTGHDEPILTCKDQLLALYYMALGLLDLLLQVSDSIAAVRIDLQRSTNLRSTHKAHSSCTHLEDLLL